MYMHDTRRAGTASSPIAASFWAQEGGANLISFEMIRRLAGLDLQANYDWRAPPATPVVEFYSWRAQPGSGEFTRGYDNTKGFLRALIVQRVQAGESVDDALREVSRGAIEGWYVNDGAAPRQGLTARMQAGLDNAWDPANALLDWTLSYAADDITSNTAFQDASFLRIWNLPGEHPIGWRPAAVLTETGVRITTFERFGGSSHHLHLLDSGTGLGFAINSSSPMLHWKLIRIR
jgi:hypothetical protein